MTFVRSAHVALIGLLALSLGGCSSLGPKYFIQAGLGQLELSNRARPIQEVLKDEKTPPRIRELLALVPGIKTFGEANGLKPTHNYTDYVKLDRPAVVWVVSASEQFSFQSLQWGFPLVGSFNYLGWFNAKDAREYADRIAQDGYDVDVRPAGAYSTLGWFHDSILSTMIPDDDTVAVGELAEVILHESVHATLYVKGQSAFNESLASFVAEKLTPVYLAGRQGSGSAELKAYRKGLEFNERYTKEMHQAYVALDALYESSVSLAEKTERKAVILESLRKSLGIKRGINNATLIQFKTYGTGKAEFEALLESCSGSIPRMLASLAAVKSDSFSSEQSENLGEVLIPLSQEKCR